MFTVDGRRDASTSCRSRCHERGPRRASSPSCSTSGRARRELDRLGARSSSSVTKPASARCTIGIVGKYVAPRRALQEPQRGAAPRRHRQRRAASNLEYIDSEEIEQRGAAALLGDVRRHPGRPAASARAAPRARSRRSATRARRRCRSSASASACSWRWSSSRATCCGLDGRQLDRVRPDDAAPGGRPDARASAASRTRAARCASAPTPACSSAGTRAADAYGATEISERHRHRYEVNNDYRDALERHGPGALRAVARRPAGRDDRAARPPVLRRLPVPPRVQVAAASRRTRCSRRSSRAALRGPPGRPPAASAPTPPQRPVAPAVDAVGRTL